MKQKIFTSLLLAIIICTTAIAQPIIKRQRTIGGSSEDDLHCMYLTKDGGLIAGGNSQSNISSEKTENSRGVHDYWVVKLSRSGNIQWDKTIGGNDYDFLYTLQQTSDGGYILGGTSYSSMSGEKTENGRGASDYWVVKLNSSGDIQWNKTIGGSDGDYLFSLQQTSDGGCILGGSSYSNISGEKTENSRGNEDYWIVKLDNSGNIQWDKTIGGNNEDALRTVQQTTDGGYVLGGYSYSDISYEKTGSSRGGYDYWIVKLDGSGNIQWDKTIGGNYNDVLHALQQTSDGGYILGGSSDSNIFYEKSENTRGDYDYWVVKLDGSGNIQWDKTMGSTELDELISLQQTKDGGYILGGDSYSQVSYEKTESSRGSYDYWAIKLDSKGAIQWDKTIGGGSVDFLYSIKEIGQGHYILGGYSFSGKSGDKTQVNRDPFHRSADYWLVELVYRNAGTLETTAIPDANNIKAAENNNTKIFSAFPNPAKDILHILTNGKATFTLTNQSGKISLTKTINNKGEINIAHLSAGLYYLKNIETGVVQKVLISR